MKHEWRKHEKEQYSTKAGPLYLMILEQKHHY